MDGSPGRSNETLELVRGGTSLPLGFAAEGPRIYLVARERSARWPVETLREGRARLRLDRRTVEGRAQLIVDPSERERVLNLFRDKYGPEGFARWYARPARVLLVEPDNRPVPTDGYYGWLEAEFDNVADDYDRHILGNRINRLLRDRSLAWLQTRFANSHYLLEIGCGSGMETLPLLRSGHEILAVDISDRMLEVVRRKARDEGIQERLRTRHLRARDLDRVLTDCGPGSFDGAYSTYGALNCEPDLRPLPGVLRKLLREGGTFVAGVYNRWCLFEILGYSLTLQFGRAWGRRKNPVLVGSSRFCVDIYAYSVDDFRKLFRDRFRLDRLEGVPVFLPPSDLSSYAERFGSHFGRLASIDARVARHWPWNRFGDHFLLTFRRT